MAEVQMAETGDGREDTGGCSSHHSKGGAYKSSRWPKGAPCTDPEATCSGVRSGKGRQATAWVVLLGPQKELQLLETLLLLPMLC